MRKTYTKAAEKPISNQDGVNRHQRHKDSDTIKQDEATPAPLIGVVAQRLFGGQGGGRFGGCLNRGAFPASGGCLLGADCLRQVLAYWADCLLRLVALTASCLLRLLVYLL